MRERLGRRDAIAVVESDHQDDHRNSEWVFGILAHTTKLRDQISDEIEKDILGRVDAELVSFTRLS